MNDAARQAVEQTWLRILNRRHPEVAWTLVPSGERDADTSEKEGGES